MVRWRCFNCAGEAYALQHRDAWQKVGKLSKEEASALTASAAAGHESEDRVVHLYGTLLSQPTRSVLWFCQLNNIPVEFHLVNLLKREQKSSEFTRM
jgi:hypothetical protein